MIFGTLGRYVGRRFGKTILAVFAGFFALIYLVDFVELLRRSGEIEGANPALIAFLSLLRAPAVSEQVLPFAVLFGAMVALLNLSRKLELVVARAAGVSAWQFLAPPLAFAASLGLFSILVYNPLSAALKQRADRIETRLFGKGGSAPADTSMWIRQKSVEGTSILRAERSADAGLTLGAVTAFVYDEDGRFKERVEAAAATLKRGEWTLSSARVLSPGKEPRDLAAYALKTNLHPDQVAQAFVPPDTVSFWELGALAARTRAAGLDATGYELRRQVLMARPLFLVAMVMIAASFSLRFFRMGGVARNVLSGVAAGFVLYVVTKLASDLGGAGLVSLPFAAWSPAIGGVLFGTLAVLTQEDG
jgi:lipopolysaccharide export system permease protein